MEDKRILLSGVKPTGRPHIGNYFGAMRQFVELQSKYDSFFFIADYHALTTVQNGKEMSENILGVALDYLAIGLDPKKSLIYKQSDTPEVAELAWIFDCLTTMPYLMRAHAYKDAEAKNKEINAGVFNYPMLMAADILIQDADIVPVGQDQKQHVEYARDTAEKFNRVFGDAFKMPEPLILESVKVVPGTDGQKMSKSYNNTIPLFAEHEEIKKAIMTVPTDSKSISEPKSKDSPLFKLYELFANDGTKKAADDFIAGGVSYKEFKEMLIELIERFISPMREKRKELSVDTGKVLKILADGGEVARIKAGAKMQKVRKLIGTALY